MDAFSTGPHVFQIVHWNIAKSENTTSTYLKKNYKIKKLKKSFKQI